MKIFLWVMLLTLAGGWLETGNAQDLRQVRISYSSRSNSTTVYQVALAKGIFKEEGLKWR
jgi:ABC-type nitrate/sulfonate/bicarbonate transport system substrate-binding protein